jgi:hypothetical protein
MLYLANIPKIREAMESREPQAIVDEVDVMDHDGHENSGLGADGTDMMY